MWMVVQLAEQDPVAALNAYFQHMQPVMEQERAANGKVALQCVRVLEHLLGKLDAVSAATDTVAPLSCLSLLRLVRLCHPKPAAQRGAGEAKEGEVGGSKAKSGSGKAEQAGGSGGGGGGGGGEVSSKNKEAVEELRQLLPRVRAASPLGVNKHTCAFSAKPILLPVVVADGEYSAEARAFARESVVGMLASDAGAFKVTSRASTYHIAYHMPVVLSTCLSSPLATLPRVGRMLCAQARARQGLLAWPVGVCGPRAAADAALD